MRRDLKAVELLKKVGIIRSVRGKLVLYFLLFLIIPLSTLTYLQYSDERHIISDNITRQLSSIADTRKNSIQNWLSERTGDLGLMATDIYMQKSLEKLEGKHYTDRELLTSDPGYKELKVQLIRFTKHISYSGALLTDNKGRVLVSTDDSMAGTDVRDTDYFRDAMKAGPGKFYIKGVFLEQGTVNPTMGFSRVVMSPEARRGVIGVAVLFYNLDVKFFPLILDWPGKGATGETLLVTREGNDVVFLNRLKYIDAQPTTYKVPVSKGWPLPAIYSSGGLEGSIEARDYRGVRVIAAYRYIPETKWGLITKIDASQAFYPALRFRDWTLLYIMISALLVIVLMTFLAKRIIEPIVLLAATADRIAKGDFNAVLPPGGNDEIGELTRSFSRMTADLKATSDEVAIRGVELQGKNKELSALAESLEAKVKERTRELEAMNLAQLEIVNELDARSKALEKSREELSESARRLEESRNRVSENLELAERANVELRRIDYMKDQFLGIISHELRTPLSLIMGYASNLLTDPKVKMLPAVEEEIEGVYKGAERLRNIISEMLDISKIDSRGLTLTIEKVNISELINEVIAELETFIKERKQVVDTSGMSEVPDIPLDRRRMSQVLVNILGNAIKFTPDNGVISVTSHVHRAEHHEAKRPSEVLAEHIDIVIKDTGIGLDKAEVENIFDKFYEVGDIERHTTSKYRFLGRGVGLGLPIARGIIEAHGGWLWAESEGYDPVRCLGSSFHIMLPLRQPVQAVFSTAPAVSQAREEEAAAIRKSIGVVPEHGRRSVLVIEDDTDLLKLTEFVLREKYEVHTAADGIEGIRLARELRPDLILLDVYMDGMNGYEVCETLKADPKTKGITVALFTAGVQKWEVEKGFSSGADDYITKPFKPAELIAKVDDLIAGGMAVGNNSVD